MLCIQLITEVLKVSDASTLTELENVLKKSGSSKKRKAKKLSIYDFVAVTNKEDSAQMKQFVEDTCETIDNNDWK